MLHSVTCSVLAGYRRAHQHCSTRPPTQISSLGTEAVHKHTPRAQTTTHTHTRPHCHQRNLRRRSTWHIGDMATNPFISFLPHDQYLWVRNFADTHIQKKKKYINGWMPDTILLLLLGAVCVTYLLGPPPRTVLAICTHTSSSLLTCGHTASHTLSNHVVPDIRRAILSVPMQLGLTSPSTHTHTHPHPLFTWPWPLAGRRS